MHVVTIVARNFLPRAAVLARTHRAHNPDDQFSVLVVDAEPDEVAGTADYAVLTPAHLNLAADEFQRMALIYDVTELSTALKPWALELLLDGGAEVATYLDPDIAVYASLHEIEELSLEHGIVLTPHTTRPMPRDGLAPSEAQIMGAGVYNLGFIAVDQGARPMLTWWQERLLRDSVSAPTEMLFADQRWIDLVPGYFRHTVLTDPTYNVAYWNLDTRPLVRVDGAVHVEGYGPLRFFHFSGYEPDRPWVLSKYHLDRPRVVLSEQPVVADLCREYAAWITDPAIGAGPGGAVLDMRYRFDRLPDGTRVTRVMRHAMREAVIDSDGSGVGYPPGWRDGEAVRAWFREPVRDDCPTNRYLYALWQARGDLRRHFVAPLGGDGAAFVEWAWSWAPVDADLVVELLPEPEPGSQAVVGRARGVNLAGYFTAEMGVGEMGRLLVDAVRVAGLPCSTLLDTTSVSRQQHPFDASPDQTRYPVTVAAVNADQFPRWARESDPALREGHTVGMWAWEVEEFPEYDEALELVNEVWTLSSFSREAIARATDKPVHVIPLPIREPEPVPPLDRAALGLPEGPYLLFAFDYLSVFERKNPLGLVDAFCRAFPDGDGPALVIKSMNGDRFRSDRERLRASVAARPDITLLEDYLHKDQLGALMAECTAYVSLHRAEGYGLTMAEAMARGRPVVATAYSGNMDFMDSATALLVPYDLVPVPSGSGPYPSSTVWAEPDLQRAAAHLRWVVQHPEEAATLGARAATSVRQRGSIRRTAEFVTERVDAALITAAAAPEERDPEATRAERAIKRARRAVRAPAA
ncbi:MAG TPA: glycosyltransferase family 4 protein, partial [Nocardioides sp.]|nr:glycosyltransferase family 4 protein [Nocardioides sp.]